MDRSISLLAKTSMASYAQLENLVGYHREALSMMLGEKLGAGCSREVYVNRLNPVQVVKVQLSLGFQNVQEWLIWKEVEDKPELAKWFAPCDHISPDGNLLIQRRTEHPKIAYPEQVPRFFTDLKLTNWGELDGRIVCHDYALLARYYSMTKHMRKADWWRLDT